MRNHRIEKNTSVRYVTKYSKKENMSAITQRQLVQIELTDVTVVTRGFLQILKILTKQVFIQMRSHSIVKYVKSVSQIVVDS